MTEKLTKEDFMEQMKALREPEETPEERKKRKKREYMKAYLAKKKAEKADAAEDPEEEAMEEPRKEVEGTKELDSAQFEIKMLNEELRKAQSDIVMLKDTIVRMAMRMEGVAPWN